MSLAGNLEVFPLDEVLLMLTRSSKSGCLRIEAPSTQGRIYLQDGSITLSTVGTDEDFRRQLVLATLVDDDGLRNVENGTSTLLAEGLPSAPEGELEGFLREHSIESLHRIHRHRTGDFDFVVDLTPRYQTGLSIDPPTLLSLAERRAEEWAEIESVVPDLNARYRMIRRLPDDEAVTVNPSTWYILSALEGGTSVHGLAAALGVSSFKAAFELAHLARNELVEEVASKRNLRSQLAEEIEADSRGSGEVVGVPVGGDGDPFAEGPGDEWDGGEAQEASADQPSTPAPAGVDHAEAMPAETEASATSDGTDDIGESAPGERSTEALADVQAIRPGEASEPAGSGGWTRVDPVASTPSFADPEPESQPSGDIPIAQADPTGAIDLPVLPEVGELPPVAAPPPAPESRFPADDDSWWNSWSADLDDDLTPADSDGESEPGSTERHQDVLADHESSSAPAPEAGVNQPPAEQAAEAGAGRWWAQTMDEAVEEGPADSEEFLEGVFDAVGADEETEEPQETGFGRGLLRRRLMGSVPRDGDDDR